MWFRILILVVAGAFIVKATIALAMPERFYAERTRLRPRQQRSLSRRW
jgi:hypothetical protein